LTQEPAILFTGDVVGPDQAEPIPNSLPLVVLQLKFIENAGSECRDFYAVPWGTSSE
jgi:hypothetical protein